MTDQNNSKSLPEPGQELNSPSVKKGIRWGRLLAWAVVIILLVVVGLRLFQVQQGPLAIGEPAPNLILTTFEGEEISLDSLKGKVVVLNFWASWCKPCEQEAADLEAAWRSNQSRGDVVFLGIDWTDTEKNGLAYLKKFDITYPNGPDLGTRISQKYRITGVPETYIIDKEGNLAYFKLSPFNSLMEIIQVIDPLLGD